MINKLRKRVIILTMIAVFIVLLLLMGVVNIANRFSIDSSVNQLLDILEENGGTFAAFGKHGGKMDGMPEGELGGQMGGMPEGELGGQMDGDLDGGNTSGGPGSEAQTGGGPGSEAQTGGGPHGFDDFDDLKPGMSKETPYETRFFSVTLNDSTGEMVRIDTSRIAAVTQDEALELAKSVATKLSSRSSAYISYSDSTYKYRVVDSDGDETLYIFVDASSQLDAGRRFLLISVLVSLGGLIAIGILVILLSPMMVRPMAESYEKQKRFITNASHELKTPLAVIKSCNEVVELEAGESKWTESISEQVDRMTALIGQMVSLSKMDEAADFSNDITKENLDLADLVAKALDPFYLLAEQKGLTLLYSGPPAAGASDNSSTGASDNAASTEGDNAASAEGDNAASAASLNLDGNAASLNLDGNAASLTELINILADNAIKYTSPGGTIKFSLSQEGSKIILEEENPAEGLTPGDQGQFFDRFYRGDQSHTKSDDTGGYGIGLSLAQAIVTAHGGKISASSPDGKTLRFRVEL